MKLNKDTWDERLASVKWNLLLSGFVFTVFLICLFFIHSIVKENALRAGSEISYNYSSVDEANMQTYSTLLTVESEYLAELFANGTDSETIEQWLQDYFVKMQLIAGDIEISPYALVNGEMISAHDWKFDEDYDAYQTEWYQKAIAAKGDIIFTDVYEDAIYKKPVITIAKVCSDGGDVIAFDMYPGDFSNQTSGQELPEGSTYFVCDAKGTLVYKEIGQGVAEDNLDENFQELYQRALNREAATEMESYYTSDGKRMEVYYREASNGWLFILSIPYSYLNRDWNIVIWIYIFALVTAMLVILIMWLRANVRSRELRNIHETVQILGNSYYAYYKVNIRQETYQMIRGSEYVKNHLPKRGKYIELLRIFKNLIIEEEYQEFYESFSIENIHKQIENQIKDFGGDFRRLFDNEYKWVNVRMLFSPSLNSEEMVLCFRIVEDEKQRQLKRMELLEDALRAANVSEISQKQFFSNISHDMRTPLNVIIGMSELAEKCMDDTERVQEYLQKINFSSKHLLGLINDILEMSRLEQGLSMEKSTFNIRTCLEECINVFRASAKKSKKEIGFNCILQHEIVQGDALRLEQIVNNLMSNALKFTREGDCVSVSVREIDSQEHAKYQIVVEDTGIGMSQEFLQHIFEPYERETRFGDQSIEGTGLGMPIVKSLVSMMGGEITVQSVVNCGSMFTVILPFETVEDVQESKDEAEIDMNLCDRTILLAEDYELNMELTTDILTMNGAKVIQAWNGQEAVKLFEQSEEFSINAILMDMQMPIMDGCEAARCIRCLQREDVQVPIIALTANAFSEDISKTLEAGMNAHISKPLDVKVLCDTLHKWMKESTNA